MCDVIAKALKRQEEIVKARKFVHALECFKKHGMSVEDELQIVVKKCKNTLKLFNL